MGNYTFFFREEQQIFKMIWEYALKMKEFVYIFPKRSIYCAIFKIVLKIIVH